MESVMAHIVSWVLIAPGCCRQNKGPPARGAVKVSKGWDVPGRPLRGIAGILGGVPAASFRPFSDPACMLGISHHARPGLSFLPHEQ